MDIYPLFYSARTLHILHGKTYRKPLHQHAETAELLLITEGRGRFTINNKTYTAGAGSIVLLNAGDWHEEAAAPPFSALSLCCSGALIDALPIGHVRPAALAPVHKLREFPKLLSILDDILAENSSSHPNKEATVRLYLSLFLEVLGRNLRPSLQSAPDAAQHMRMARHFIEENCHRELTLEELSAEIGLSKYYLARQFKEHIGHSPIQYVIQCRLHIAKRLLETTALPVAEIAQRTGYKSGTHFQQAFKKSEGTTPGAYRRICTAPAP
ncbi:helix-turn-helix domain-containing protein [Planococcus sp. FY231025]|uniref:helix-turn-helix domain-containing protein n=1 Tax=Planococcus sp. FY231025 TaxID=3455699 RepID=UPI003F8D9777